MNINNGKLKTLINDKYVQILGKTSAAIPINAALRTIPIDAWTGPFYPKNSTIIITNKMSINGHTLTLDEDLSPTQTSISVASYNLTEEIKDETNIFVNLQDGVDNKYRRYTTTHLNMNFNSHQKNLNDFLGTITQGTFTTDSGSILATGTNKGNSWGGRYGMLIPMGLDFRIHQIKANIVNNFPADTVLTLSFWKKPFDVDGSSNSTVTEVAQQTFDGKASFNYGLQFDSGDISLNANSLLTDDVLIPTIRQSKTQTSTKNFYADIEIISSTYFQ